MDPVCFPQAAFGRRQRGKVAVQTPCQASAWRAVSERALHRLVGATSKDGAY